MKIFKRVITIIASIILIVILSFNIFNFVSINILGNELPTINGYAYLEVISGSMEPKISVGDIIIIDTKDNNYKVKDIVTFKDANGSFVTHRIIEIKDDEIITQGDANNTVDDPINKNQIVGHYVYKLDGIGALIKSFRSPLTLIMILIIGVIICVLVSTDSKGNVILTDDEKEYLEFLKFKKNKKKIKDEDKTEEIQKTTRKSKKTSSNKITKSSKNEVIKEQLKEKTTKKTTQKKTETKKTSQNKITQPSKNKVEKEQVKKTTPKIIKKKTEEKPKQETKKKITTKKETSKKNTTKTEAKKSTTKKTKK